MVTETVDHGPYGWWGCCTHSVDYYAAMKISKPLLHVTSRMNLTNNIGGKKPDMKEYVLHVTLYITFKLQQN